MKGFTTVYLLMILLALVMALVMIINAACGFAARSEIDTVCASAGRSVLSEYQKDLYERYGIFALRADDALLTRLAAFYTTGSLAVVKALVQPFPLKIYASAEAHPALETAAFAKQVRRLAPGAALTKGNVIEYLLELASFSEPDIEDISDLAEEADPEGFDPAKEAEKQLGKEQGGAKGNSIRAAVYRDLPSRLLGYPKRISLLLSGGITDLSFAAAIEDEYMMAVCSNALDEKDGCFLLREIEYILYGNSSDAANFKAVKLSLFALRMAVNEVKYLSKTGEFLASTAAAAALSVTEVRTLIDGGKVDGMDYGLYLRILLALLPRNEKLARLMDVMQLDIREVCEANFSFKTYAYGFDLNAVFIMKKRLGDVYQTFTYR